MKPPPFRYHDPRSIDDVVALLGRLDNAKLLAGGQSLMPMLNMRFVLPDHIIDLNKVAGLSYITDAAETLEVGAMTRQRDLEYSDLVARRCPLMHEAIRLVGHRQTRNRGTFGGSLCHLDPSAELLNMTALHDGTLTATAKSGERKIASAEWVQGVMTNALAPGEMLTGIELRAWPAGHGFAFEEFARRHGDFAIAAIGCLVIIDAAGAIEKAALCVSGLGPGPVRLAGAEKLLAGQKPSHELFRAAAVEAEALDAMDDAFVTAVYRKHLARVLTYRALERAVKGGAARRAAA
jgi:carbon-monoxide dehydrogenase medium subunit